MSGETIMDCYPYEDTSDNQELLKERGNIFKLTRKSGSESLNNFVIISYVLSAIFIVMMIIAVIYMNSGRGGGRRTGNSNVSEPFSFRMSPMYES